MTMLDVHSSQPSRIDRRNHSSRAELLGRVYGEFHEMPCLRLTAAQARLLLGLKADICERILTGLVADGRLTYESQRYRLNDARSWPAGRLPATVRAH
jgi:hypothetical protein